MDGFESTGIGDAGLLESRRLWYDQLSQVPAWPPSLPVGAPGRQGRDERVDFLLRELMESHHLNIELMRRVADLGLIAANSQGENLRLERRIKEGATLIERLTRDLREAVEQFPPLMEGDAV